jgi:hypothetical protein
VIANTSPGRANITFTSQADFAFHWIVMIKPQPARDWTWDVLAYEGIIVKRDGIEVGHFPQPLTLTLTRW